MAYHSAYQNRQYWVHIPHLDRSVPSTTLCSPAAWRGVLGLSDADRPSREQSASLPWSLQLYIIILNSMLGPFRRGIHGGLRLGERWIHRMWLPSRPSRPEFIAYYSTRVLSGPLYSHTGCVPRKK